MNYTKAGVYLLYALLISVSASSCVALKSAQTNSKQASALTDAKERIARKRAALEQPEARELTRKAKQQLMAIWLAAELDSEEAITIIAEDAIKSILEEVIQQFNHMSCIYRRPDLKYRTIEFQKELAPAAPYSLLEAYAETMCKLQDLVIRAHNGDGKK